ncbi:unnamed protein product, partial [marine sediment metagenome]
MNVKGRLRHRTVVSAVFCAAAFAAVGEGLLAAPGDRTVKHPARYFDLFTHHDANSAREFVVRMTVLFEDYHRLAGR